MFLLQLGGLFDLVRVLSNTGYGVVMGQTRNFERASKYSQYCYIASVVATSCSMDVCQDQDGYTICIYIYIYTHLSVGFSKK